MIKPLRTPRSLDISITNRCNLRCRYCYHFESPDDVERDLPTEEWLKFFEELKGCGVLDLRIGGGEPFLREDLKEILQGVVKNRMRFGLLSNGTLITEDMAKFIANTGRCDGVQISLDGARASQHDACRGEGNFDKTLRGIENLKKYGVKFSVRVTIHKYNVHYLENIARFLLEDMNLLSFSSNSAYYMGLCKKNADLIQLTIEERNLAMKTLAELSQKYPQRVKAQAGPLAETILWNKMEWASRNKTGIPEGGFLSSCKGVFSKLAVRADGALVPCNQASHCVLGRINRDNLKDLWLNNEELIKYRNRMNISLKDFDYCRKCDYVDYCKGGCPGIAHSIMGQDHHPSPEGCYKKFLEEGGKLPVYNL